MINFKKEFEEWYHGYHPLPTKFNDKANEKFVFSVTGFFAQIVGGMVKSQPTVVFTNDLDTASVDLEANTVYLPLCHIESQKNPGVSIQQVLFSYNALVLHEFGHIRYTKYSFKKIDSLIKRFNSKNSLMNLLYQVIEDLYIDNANVKEYPRFSIFYEALMSYFFDESEHIGKLKELPVEVNTFDDAAAIASSLIGLKRAELRHHKGTTIFETCKRMMLGAMALEDQFDRVILSVEVYDYLTSSLPKEETDGDGEDGEGKDGNGKTSSLIEELLKMLGDRLVDSEEMSGVEGTIIKAKSFSISSIGPSSSGLVKIECDCDQESFTKLLEKYDANAAAPELTMSENWSGLSGLMKVRSEVRRHLGPQMNRGNKMNQLYRINIDSKVFAQVKKTQGLAPQEIAILVDLSYSMTSSRNYAKALREAWGMAVALESGRHRVAVYGHTADTELRAETGNENSYSVCLLVKIKGFDETSAVIKDRLAAVNHSLLCNNADGYAIEMVGEKMSSVRNAKTIIVISDGAPSCREYYGKTGEKHTSAVVKDLRNKGINVVSVSIIESCVDDNDKIYGAANNFSCTDLNIVELLIDKILAFKGGDAY
jgi:hypothetical protein